MVKRIECSPKEATVAVWGSVEYRPHKSSFMWWESAPGAIFAREFMLDHGAKFYKEVLEPCVVQMRESGPILVLQLKEGADAQKVYEQVLKIEGVEA